MCLIIQQNTDQTIQQNTKIMIITMRFKHIIVFGLFILIGLISCEKESTKTIDYIDPVIGEYDGIEIFTLWQGAIVGYSHDTTAVIINISKSSLDSIINISFNPMYGNQNFSFKCTDGQFISTLIFHRPILNLTNDSLYFKHHPAEGPQWTEFIAKKIN